MNEFTGLEMEPDQLSIAESAMGGGGSGGPPAFVKKKMVAKGASRGLLANRGIFPGEATLARMGYEGSTVKDTLMRQGAFILCNYAFTCISLMLQRPRRMVRSTHSFPSSSSSFPVSGSTAGTSGTASLRARAASFICNEEQSESKDSSAATTDINNNKKRQRKSQLVVIALDDRGDGCYRAAPSSRPDADLSPSNDFTRGIASISPSSFSSSSASSASRRGPRYASVQASRVCPPPPASIL